MDWGKLFGMEKEKKPSSAQIAHDRLKVVVAYQRQETNRSEPSYLPQMREELLAVVRRYVLVSEDDVQVSMKNEDGLDVLAMDIALPENSKVVRPYR